MGLSGSYPATEFVVVWRDVDARESQTHRLPVWEVYGSATEVADGLLMAVFEGIL